MTVTTVSNTTEQAAPGATTSKSALGKDDFLKLLMSQLSNQDPLAPMDSQAFVAQLAQFSNVEQLQQQSQRLDALLMAQTSNNQLQAASLVGREAVFRTDGVDQPGGASVPLSGSLADAAASVTVSIKDSTGKTVRTLLLGTQPAGALSTAWDGRDASGATVPAGRYTVDITAADADGRSVSCATLGRSRITGVSFDSGYAELVLANGQRVRLADVTQINEAPGATATTAASPTPSAVPTPLSLAGDTTP